MKTFLRSIKHGAETVFRNFLSFFEWLLIALAIGIVGGLVGSLFYLSIGKATDIRGQYPWLIYLLPVGGLIIAAIYRITADEGKSTNTVISSILKGENIPASLTPVIFVSTVITHLLGGSAGREGAALQIGGSIGYNIGKHYKLDEKEERIAILSGMSAVFSALFGTPVTAVIFALEVCSVGIIHYSGLIPCGIASVTAYGIMRLFHIAPTHFALNVFALEPVMLVKITVLGCLCAVLSMFFCKILHVTYRDAEKWIKNPFLRIAAGGALIALLTYIIGNQDYNGGGVSIIADAIEQGKSEPYSFFLKLLFTAITLGCGFKGGEIVPTFFIGATFGCTVGPLLGIPPQLAAAIGLIAMFCGCVNCPVASLILSIELFGSGNLVYFASACFISYMLSGYSGLYSEQKIMYSKFKAEFINRKTE